MQGVKEDKGPYVCFSLMLPPVQPRGNFQMLGPGSLVLSPPRSVGCWEDRILEQFRIYRKIRTGVEHRHPCSLLVGAMHELHLTSHSRRLSS